MRLGNYSLRRYLLTGVLMLVTLSLTLSALLGFFSARHEMEELFDARLVQSANITEKLLLRFLAQTPDKLRSDTLYHEWESIQPAQSSQSTPNEEYDAMSPLGQQFERTLFFQLLDKNGGILLRSPNAPSQPLAKFSSGFAVMQNQQHSWRTFTRYNAESQTWLIVAERDDERSELAVKIATLSILPLLITLPMLLLLLWWLVTRGLAPLSTLVRQVAKRHPANLMPFSMTSPAKEVRLLIHELNRLMHTLEQKLDSERQFTNEAAHELRTPLAVLRLHCENALSASQESERQQSLGKILSALDRSDRLLYQLLTHARLEHHNEMSMTCLDLRENLRETLATLVPLALKKKQQISFIAPEAVFINGQSTLLEIMFSNLIDNAIRYTPPEGEVIVQLEKQDGIAYILVQDTGPGVPSELLSRLTERFFRVSSQQGEGAGLGMAIVQRIALLHQAQMSIQNRPSGGLEISVVMGLSSTQERHDQNPSTETAS